MARATDRQPSMLGSLDWWTIGIYLALLTFGWVSVCGASYTYGDTDIFSLGPRSGMRIVRIRTRLRVRVRGSFWVPCAYNQPSLPSLPQPWPWPN